jgi:hypothetical protein
MLITDKLRKDYEAHLFGDGRSVLYSKQSREIPLADLDGTHLVSDSFEHAPYVFLVKHHSRDPKGRLEKMAGVVQSVCASGHVFIHNPKTLNNLFQTWEAVFPEQIVGIKFLTDRVANVFIIDGYNPVKQALKGRMAYIEA